MFDGKITYEQAVNRINFIKSKYNELERELEPNITYRKQMKIHFGIKKWTQKEIQLNKEIERAFSKESEQYKELERLWVDLEASAQAVSIKIAKVASTKVN